ncbi:hypothetical protein Klosneuvirus_2_254 [Klosneuvirus KNV1]|uniref:Uncharacterized protein n=1 Tax=Klosneuvirus KNV1 TaxID=1977640 RepID=A0A1V0SJL4_9VIRU|nr:hypothetical protein Klosneuvirus_2_254 [Klosneuvirus KNV1]
MESIPNDETYYKKYLKYKAKYLSLNGGKRRQSDERYDCKPSNKFNEICVSNVTGKYKSKNSCVNDCETKYINHHLIKSNIKSETMKFSLFIKDIIDNENFSVYIKGGNVIGLSILKMIYDKYKDNDAEFKKKFDEFLKLNLMKDWDFAAYSKQKITPEYREKLDKIANKYKLVPRAKTFILYQTRKPLLLGEGAMFEISVLDVDTYSKLEIPMTTMKIKVHEYNLKYIYMFAKSFLTYQSTGEPFDFDILKKMIEKIHVIVHPHKNGLYDPGNNFDKGTLSSELIKFINKFSKNNKLIAQFLVIQLQDPYRLLFRLPEKNIPKTNTIKNFITKNLQNKQPSWLLDTNEITTTIKSFVKTLGNKLYEIYKDKGISEVINFMSGISFNRIISDYDTISDDNKELLKQIFKPLADHININEINTSDKLIDFIKFLTEKKLF